MAQTNFLDRIQVKPAEPTKKQRIIFYGDSPTCATGFGQVSRNILPALQATGRYEVQVLGINYWGDPHHYPFPIWPMAVNNQRDPYGRQRLQQHLLDPALEYDFLFFMQDTFILDFLPSLLANLTKAGKRFKSVFYYPIDGIPKKVWVEAAASVDQPVTYTQFGRQQSISLVPSIEEKLKIIPHGVDPRVFYPLPKPQVQEFRRKYLGPLADKFIIMNLNRNQQRKDIPATIRAFAELRKHRPNTLLYLHMAAVDQGWNLPEVISAFGLDITKDVILPQNFSPAVGFPLEVVNMIYNMSDLVVSTTVGEGWGLSWIEAMACRVPICYPINTCLGEYITEETGLPHKSGGDPDHITVLPNDNEVPRPTSHIYDLVDKLVFAYDNREEITRRAHNAYNMVTRNLVWENNINPQWVKLFDNMIAQKKAAAASTDLARPVLRGEVL